jgi:hypothetical protein
VVLARLEHLKTSYQVRRASVTEVAQVIGDVLDEVARGNVDVKRVRTYHAPRWMGSRMDPVLRIPRLQSVIRADCGTTQERDLATRSNDDCPGIDRASELLWDVRFLTCGRSRNVCPSVLVSEF